MAKIQVYVKKSVQVGSRTMEIGFGEVREVSAPHEVLGHERALLAQQLEEEVDRLLPGTPSLQWSNQPPSDIPPPPEKPLKPVSPAASTPESAPTNPSSVDMSPLPREEALRRMAELRKKIEAKTDVSGVRGIPEPRADPDSRHRNEAELKSLGKVFEAKHPELVKEPDKPKKQDTTRKAAHRS